MRTRPLTNAPSRPSRRLPAVAVAAATAVTVAGLGAAPAQSAGDPRCPTAFPVGSLVRDQPVTGLTVSQGTTPEGFTGKVIGVLDNGMMPGLDMILVRLTSPEIDRVGIWSGMSGSPVYASDGRLIGAVSAGLAAGPSPVAGVTPAADMLEMLSTGSQPATAPLTSKVALPDRMADRIVRSGAATVDEVESGMSQLPLPLGIAGLGSQQRFRTVSRLLDLEGVRLMRAGTTASSGAAAAAMVPGGNLAAAIAYGDITAAGVGTTTVVCGEEIVGFGHPMMWTGPSSLSLHGADALFVQEDPTFTGFKVANIGAPVGTITSDRMPGIVGRVGATPVTSDITSTVTSGSRSRTGATHITVPDLVPDLAVSHLLANEDRIFDGIGKGSASLSWTVSGTREDGSPFQLHRADVYADPYDITFASAFDLYDALSRLEYNGVEDISLDAVDASATLTRQFDHYLIKRVDVRRSGTWVQLDESRELSLRAGTTKLFRVQLSSPVSGSRRLILEVPVPPRAAGLFGSLSIFGGNTGTFDEEEFFLEDFNGGTDEPQDFDEILASLKREPGNDDVVANLDFFDEEGGVVTKRHRREATGLPVDGALNVGVTVR
jgi:hypothetical protein